MHLSAIHLLTHVSTHGTPLSFPPVGNSTLAHIASYRVHHLSPCWPLPNSPALVCWSWFLYLSDCSTVILPAIPIFFPCLALTFSVGTLYLPSLTLLYPSPPPHLSGSYGKSPKLNPKTSTAEREMTSELAGKIQFDTILWYAPTPRSVQRRWSFFTVFPQILASTQ